MKNSTKWHELTAAIKPIILKALLAPETKNKYATQYELNGKLCNQEKAIDILLKEFIINAHLIISACTKEALSLKKSKMERTGNVAYGYQLSKDGVHLERNQNEQKIIAQACALFAVYGYSLRIIGRKLEKHKMYPRTGKHWHPKTINSLLKTLFERIST